jgi:hypothetical protein
LNVMDHHDGTRLQRNGNILWGRTAAIIGAGCKVLLNQ